MLGIDLVEIKDFKQAVEKYGGYFLKKIFTPLEIKFLTGFTEAELESSPAKLAGFFAIKEAVVKALGLKDFKWRDIEIRNNGDEIKITASGINRIFSREDLNTSVSSTRDCVVAIALLTAGAV